MQKLILITVLFSIALGLIYGYRINRTELASAMYELHWHYCIKSHAALAYNLHAKNEKSSQSMIARKLLGLTREQVINSLGYPQSSESLDKASYHYFGYQPDAFQSGDEKLNWREGKLSVCIRHHRCIAVFHQEKEEGIWHSEYLPRCLFEDLLKALSA